MALDLADKSPNGYTLTNHGATEYTATHPFAASTEAVQVVRASSQYLEAAGSSGILAANASFTIEAWLRIQTFANYNVYVGLDDDVAGRAFVFDNNGAHFKIGINGSAIGTGNNTVISVDTWTHCGVTWNDATQTAIHYLNGVADGSVTTSLKHIPTTTVLLNLGRRSYAGNNEFSDCQMTEVRLWNTVRTAGQMSSNYNTQLIGNEAGLVAYYPFQALVTSGGVFVPVSNIQSLLFGSR